MAWGLVPLPGRDREVSVYAAEAYYAVARSFGASYYTGSGDSA